MRNNLSEYPALIPQRVVAEEIFGVNVATIRNWIKAGKFPPPVRLPSGKVVFRRERIAECFSEMDRKAKVLPR